MNKKIKLKKLIIWFGFLFIGILGFFMPEYALAIIPVALFSIAFAIEEQTDKRWF
jgi:uncharacterized protein YqhQ